MEHPLITQIERTGYPAPFPKKDKTVRDFYGEEVSLVHDDYVLDKNQGEIIYIDNLPRYLKEELEFEFYTGK
ncbi:YqaI family protein [Bacillus swezeyi]|uniref:YqaI family protein n=1 Tax=Bacillus swezeyi TaxID=1925020 RepID=UPI003F8C4349